MSRYGLSHQCRDYVQAALLARSVERPSCKRKAPDWLHIFLTLRYLAPNVGLEPGTFHLPRADRTIIMQVCFLMSSTSYCQDNYLVGFISCCQYVHFLSWTVYLLFQEYLYYYNVEYNISWAVDISVFVFALCIPVCLPVCLSLWMFTKFLGTINMVYICTYYNPFPLWWFIANWSPFVTFEHTKLICASSPKLPCWCLTKHDTIKHQYDA